MLEILLKLNEHIKTRRPEYYACLQPASNADEITEIEKKYDVTIPKDLKELYLWKNGQNERCYESFVNNAVFMPLESSLETAAELTSMIGYDFDIDNWWNKNWIPLFHNGGGSYICYDMSGEFTGQKEQIIEYWKSDNDRNVIASSLANFLKQLVYHYENNVSLDEFLSIAYELGFPKRFYVE